MKNIKILGIGIGVLSLWFFSNTLSNLRDIKTSMFAITAFLLLYISCMLLFDEKEMEQ